MISKAQALTVREFHHATGRNADGSPTRARRNGKTQVWKTRPDEFRIPAKQGLYQYGNITDADAHDWFDNADDAIAEGKKRAEEKALAIAQREKEKADYIARQLSAYGL